MLVNEYRLEIQFKKVRNVRNINNIPVGYGLYTCMVFNLNITLLSNYSKIYSEKGGGYNKSTHK
jgi:hypothetical protein